MIEGDELKKLSLSCDKVLFCLGSEKDIAEKPNWVRNIPFLLADRMMKDEKYKVIQDWVSFESGSNGVKDKTMLGIVEDVFGRRMLLVKPFSRDVMQIDPKGFDERFKSLKLEHPREYYGYRGGIVNSKFELGDYNSCGSSVNALIKCGMIHPSADKIIVAANSTLYKMRQNGVQTQQVPIYAELACDFADAAVKDVLMKNADQQFMRMDANVGPLYFDVDTGSTSELDVFGMPVDFDNYGIYTFVKSQLDREYKMLNDKVKMPTLSRTFSVIEGDGRLQSFIGHLESIDSSNEVKIGRSLLKMFEALDSRKIQGMDDERAAQMATCLFKAVYFISKRHPDWLHMMPEEAMEIVRGNNEFVMSVFKDCKSNTDLMYSIVDPVMMIECHKKPKKKFATTFFRCYYHDAVVSLDSINVETCDIASLCGIDIFDDENYRSKDSVEKLIVEVGKAVAKCDGVNVLPSEFNGRGEFKEGNDSKIDLWHATPDVRRSFIDALLIREAVKQGKNICGVCGGHQTIATLAGFDVGKLPEPRVDDGFGESVVESPTRGPSAVTSLHNHGVFGTEKNKENLKKNNMSTCYNKSFEQGVMEDFRINGKSDAFISTQYHGGFQLPSDARSKAILSRFADSDNAIRRSSQLGQTILANCDKIVAKSLSLEEVEELKLGELKLDEHRASLFSEIGDKLNDISLDINAQSLSGGRVRPRFDKGSSVDRSDHEGSSVDGFPTAGEPKIDSHKAAYLARKSAKRPDTLSLKIGSGEPEKSDFAKRTNSSFSRY